MECIAVSLLKLERANSRIQLLLGTLAACGSRTTPVDQLTNLFAEVLRISEWLRKEPDSNLHGPLAQELRKYQLHLERLRELLPQLHEQLLTDRSRLEAERAHLEAAAAWARCARPHP